MAPSRWLLLLSLLFLALRFAAATRVGFGDAEALYVTYGLHLQIVHLDHPGLVGLLAWAVGAGSPPSPLRLHLFTALVATAIPWLGALAARWLGAPRETAPLAGLALLAAPEISVGLFALTPDLLLAPLWLLAAGAWGRALLLVRSGGASTPWALLAGALAGLAAASKVPGALLLVAMLLSLRGVREGALRDRIGLCVGVALGLLIASPVAVAEARGGFLMLTHRLLATQQEAGFSLRNAGALVGGQLGYLSPLVAAGAILVFRAIHERGAIVARWLLLLALVSGAPLALLCLWSRVAEPHWLAPAWLPAALALPGVAPSLAAWLRRWALGTGVALSLLVHAWTLTDLAPRWLGGAYEGRFDLANDLLLWAELKPRVDALRVEVLRLSKVEPVILAPHWIVAAQAVATGGGGLRAATLACLPDRREVPDDFCRWAPRSSWEGAPLLWVSDDRFELEPPETLRGRTEALRERVELRRGGRVVRRAGLVLLLPR